ncbi:hypothetical protein D3C86_1907820 [compost metagenome]
MAVVNITATRITKRRHMPRKAGFHFRAVGINAGVAIFVNQDRFLLLPGFLHIFAG